MKRLVPVLLAAGLLAAGCTDSQSPEPVTTARATTAADAKVQATLNKLSPEDRPLAEDQKYCAVMTDSRLGSMGVPVKLMVKGEPVFVCCKGCNQTALKHPDETLKTVAELKAKARAER